ncbi:hypothetical protein [Pimelobacter simplex]|uniref:hypothetical protein n=1 Tax=Nocardioides simplex TaxID=2045 RepID=UPI003AABE250
MQTKVPSATRRLISVVLATALAMLGLVALATASAPAAQAAAGNLTGKVTDTATSSPVVGVYVVAFCADPDFDDWFACARTTTGADGTYGFNLPNGKYRVGALSGTNEYGAAYHGGGASVYDATTVTAPVGNVNIAMKRYATVGGTVSGEGTGALNLASVCLMDSYTYVEDGAQRTGWYCSALTFTKADGSYTLGAPAGIHRVGAEAASGKWRATYYASSATPEGGTNVTFGETGHQGGINITMPRNGLITGTVTDAATNAVLPFAEVAAWAEDDGEWEDVAWATADEQGAYELRVPNGTYRVSFDDPCQETCADDYQAEFWNDATSIESADDVVVANAGTVSGRNAALARNGAIGGTVTAQSGGTPIADVVVVGYRAISGGTGWDPVAFALTDAAGHYTLRAGAGTYRLEFHHLCWDDDCTVEYASEVYDDKTDLADGTDVTIVGTGTTPGIDAALAVAPATAPIENLVPPAVVSDPPKVGELAFAHVGVWYPQPENVQVSWYRSGSTQSIGTGTAIVVPPAALGETLSVKVTVTKPGFDDTTVTSEASAPVEKTTLKNLRKPAVFGVPVAGGTLEVWEGIWSAAPESYTYRWFQSGSTDPIGTGKTLVVPAAAAGKELTVEVTAKRADRLDGVATSAPVAVQPPAASPVQNVTAPAITGTPKVGTTVTAQSGTWNPTPDSVVIEWFRSGSTTPIGTGPELVVPAAAEGGTLAIRVTAKKAGSSDGVAISAPVAVIPAAGAEVENVVLPAVAGKAKVGEMLAVHPGLWNPQPDPAQTEVSWFRSGSNQAIGTGWTLVVPASAVGQQVTARVTVKKPGFGDGVASSEPTAPIGEGTLANYLPPMVFGPLVVGGTVEAWEGVWPAGPDNYTYAWYLDGTATPIGTGKQLVIPASAAGKKVRVEVTATKTAYAGSTVSSVASAVVVAAPSGPSADCTLAKASLASAQAAKSRAASTLAAAKSKVTQLKAKVTKAKKAQQKAKVKRLTAKLKKAKTAKAAASTGLARATAAVTKAQAGVTQSCS